MEETRFVVQFDDTEGKGDERLWLDTREGVCDTEEAARAERRWYDQNVGLPSRIIKRVTTETVIE